MDSTVGTDGHPDIFVLVHESRSGSTFLADVLSRHPKISIAPESSVLRNAWRWRKSNPHDEITTRPQLETLVRGLFQDEKLRAWGMDPQAIVEGLTPRLPVGSGDVARTVIVQYGHSNHPGSRIFGIKRGGWNVFNLDSVRILLPNVRCIHIVRDGRAVYASERRAIHRHTGKPFEEHASIAAWKWQHTVRSFGKARWGLEVQYERLVRNPELVLNTILRYLDVDPDPKLIEGMVHPHESTYVPEYVANLHPNVGREPLVDRIDVWRHELSLNEIRRFERIAGDTLAEKGYGRMTPRRRSDVIFRGGVEIRHRLDRLVGPHRWRKARSR